MNKKKVVVLVLSLVMICFISVLVYLNVQKDQQQTAEDQTASANDIDLSTLEIDKDLVQDIRLPNSEDVVYIEGISAEDAASIDRIFRFYEESDGGEMAEEGSLAWIYNPLLPALTDWFNPEFDLVTAFNATEHTAETDGSMAWLSVPLSQNLAAENSGEIFYYSYDEELGGYRMSAGYYLLGYVYSGMGQQVASATEAN